MSTSPDIHVLGIVYMALHVFQWQPFTLIGVLYEYDLISCGLFLSEFCF